MKVRLATLLLALSYGAQAGQPVCHYPLAASVPVSFSHGLITIEGVLDGQAITLTVDTGSTSTLLTRSEALKRGLRLSANNMRSFGVGGETTTAIARIPDITIGIAHGNDVDMLVIDDTSAPFPVGGLVGTDFLFRSDVELSPAEGKMKFFVAQDCDKPFLARWGGEISKVDMERGWGEDKRPRVAVEVNGKAIEALIDSGAATSVIDLRLAAQLGIEKDSPGVVQGRVLAGVGKHGLNSWVAHFDSIAIGGETIKNVNVTIADLWGAIRRDRNDTRSFEMTQEQPRMILGADFLSAHHVLFALSQKQFYFTYLGGKVFHTE